MNRTSIEWVRNPDGTQGFTWNPIVGCSRGCPYCYARRLAKRNGKRCAKCATFEPHLHPERLDEPLKHKRPAGIFVCSMGELYDSSYPHEWEESVYSSMQKALQHRYYILTKAGNWTDFSRGIFRGDSWYSGHFWVGMTCDGLDRKADDCRLEVLSGVRAEKRFVSYEPLLKPPPYVPVLTGWLNWIIIGAQTGRGAKRPKRKWVMDILEQADEARIPVFIKDNLLRIYPDLPRRQEVPS